VLLFGGQISEVHLRRLDAGVTEPLLQNVDRAATFEPIDRMDVAQIVETERPEVLILFLSLLGGRLNDAPEVG
jgi:hypothetical protein